MAETTPPQPFDQRLFDDALEALVRIELDEHQTLQADLICTALAHARIAAKTIADLERRLGEADELIYVAVHAGDKLNASIKRYEIEPRHEFKELVNARDRMRSFRQDGSSKMTEFDPDLFMRQERLSREVWPDDVLDRVEAWVNGKCGGSCDVRTIAAALIAALPTPTSTEKG